MFESLYKPKLPALLPDGKNQYFVIKPVTSSFSFTIPESGEMSISLTPGNPYGRIAEAYAWDDTEEEYSAPVLANQSQVLKTNYDYGRLVKFHGALANYTISAIQGATFQGQHAMISVCYPANQKPALNGSQTAYNKYSYQAIIGTQCDPENMVVGAKMTDAILFNGIGQFGQDPIRLRDSLPTGQINGLTIATASAVDSRNALIYPLSASAAIDQAFTLSTGAAPRYFRSGRILASAPGGLLSNVRFDGSCVSDNIVQIGLRVTYFMQTYDQMGRTIQTREVERDIIFNPVNETSISFTATQVFSSPDPDDLLDKPMISLVEYGMTLQLLAPAPLAVNITEFNLEIVGEATAIGGDAWTVAKPSYLWAIAGALPGSEITLNITQWFEATPNSNLFQTTSTITTPQGNMLQAQEFWQHLGMAIDNGTFAWVVKEKDWEEMCNHPDNHHDVILWEPKLHDVVKCAMNGDTSGGTQFFNKLGKFFKNAGKDGFNLVKKEGKKLLSKYGPQLLEIAVGQLGGLVGLDDEAQELFRALAKPLVGKAVGNNKLLKNLTQGNTAGGSAAGGSVPRRIVRLNGNTAKTIPPNWDRVQMGAGEIDYKLSPVTSQKSSRSITHYQWDEESEHNGGYPDAVIKLDPEQRRLIIIKSATTDKVPKNWNALEMAKSNSNVASKVAQMKTEENSNYCVTFTETRGVIVPCLFYEEGSIESTVLKASGTYYLYHDMEQYQKYKDGNWTTDKSGNKVVGHRDTLVIPFRLTPGYVLGLVSNVEFKGKYDVELTCNLRQPAFGPSVMAGLMYLESLRKVNMKNRHLLAVTGPLSLDQRGGWKFDLLPDIVGLYKTKAVHHIYDHLVPIVGNFEQADIRVTTVDEMRRKLGIKLVHPSAHTGIEFPGLTNTDQWFVKKFEGVILVSNDSGIEFMDIMLEGDCASRANKETTLKALDELLKNYKTEAKPSVSQKPKRGPMSVNSGKTGPTVYQIVSGIDKKIDSILTRMEQPPHLVNSAMSPLGVKRGVKAKKAKPLADRKNSFNFKPVQRLLELCETNPELAYALAHTRIPHWLYLKNWDSLSNLGVDDDIEYTDQADGQNKRIKLAALGDDVDNWVKVFIQKNAASG